MGYVIIKSAGDEHSVTAVKTNDSQGHTYEYAKALAGRITEALREYPNCQVRIAELKADNRRLQSQLNAESLFAHEATKRVAELEAQLAEQEEEEQPIDYMYYDAVDEYKRSQK